MEPGSFKIRHQPVHVTASGAVCRIHVGRGLALNPNLANDWLNIVSGDSEFPRFDTNPPGGITAWYSMRLTALAEDNEDAFDLDLESAMSIYDARDKARCDDWRQAFGHV